MQRIPGNTTGVALRLDIGTVAVVNTTAEE